MSSPETNGELNMESTDTAKTCEQRIDRELAERLAEFLPDVNAWSIPQCKRYLKTEGRNAKATDPDELRSELRDVIQERAFESLLSVETIRSFRLCLSWGGPADYFEIDWSENQSEWIGGRYLFQDWFDGATRPLSQELAEQLAEVFCLMPDEL
jgi:hypothetical protein